MLNDKNVKVGGIDNFLGRLCYFCPPDMDISAFLEMLEINKDKRAALRKQTHVDPYFLWKWSEKLGLDMAATKWLHTGEGPPPEIVLGRRAAGGDRA